MNFTFSINLFNHTLEKGDENFFQLTNFSTDDIGKLPLYKLFPNESFLNYMQSRFGEGKRQFDFYTYIFTTQARRIRISGIAKVTKTGYSFYCKQEGITDSTIVEEERKLSVLELINLIAKDFISQTDSLEVLKNRLSYLGKTLNASRICIYRNKPNKLNITESGLFLEWRARGIVSVRNKSTSVLTFDTRDLELWEKLMKNNDPVEIKFNSISTPIENKFLEEHLARFVLFLPVFEGDRWWGFISFERNNREKWTPDEKIALTSFASILGIAIKSSNHYKKLLETEDKLNLITRTTSTVLYTRRNNSQSFDYISESIKSLTGFDAEEIARKGLTGLIKEISTERYSVIDPGEESPDEKKQGLDYLIETKEGKSKWINNQKFEWVDESGKSIGEIGVITDITRRKEFEFDLRKTNLILHAVADFSTSIFSSLNFNQNIPRMLEQIGTAMNSSRAFIYEIEKDNNEGFVARNKYEWAAPGIISRMENETAREFRISPSKFEFLFNAINRGSFYYNNSSNLKKSGKTLLRSLGVISFIILPIKTGDEVYGLLGFDDCEKERSFSQGETDALMIAAQILGAALQMNKYVKELKETTETAQKSDRLKSEFLSQISHEIRTPLTNITSYLGLISEIVPKEIHDEFDYYFSAVQRGTVRLHRTIDELINASELQIGSYKPQIMQINLETDIFVPLLSSFQEFADDKGLLLIKECNLTNPIISADSFSLTKILEHLIDNAIKYTNIGSVKIICREYKNYIRVKVKDTGIGIAAKYLTDIYKLFSQEESGYSRRYDGNGLGMYIVKNFCDLNKIKIQVKSQKNKGTTFTLTIPRDFDNYIG